MSGLIFFTIKKSDGENSLVQTIVAKADINQKEREIYSDENPLKIKGTVTSSVPGGKIAEGFTGWVLSARNLIQEQSLLL